MKCKSCSKTVKDILRHLNSSEKCQSLYDMVNLKENRRLERLERQRDNKKILYQKKKEKILEQKKTYYKNNKEKILGQQETYYKDNRDTICRKKAISYQKSKSRVYQRQRFREYLSRKDTMSYLCEKQEHLYHHTHGFCQPESMSSLNHSIEFYDGLCNACGETTAVKISGVNRLVCSTCSKAHCYICQIEVSPNPEHGCLHFWPNGCSLNFIPGYCPLYSFQPLQPMYGFADWDSLLNKKECRMCCDIKSRYPEYELFRETIVESVRIYGLEYKRMEVQNYKCNLCRTKKKFLCEFDHHMRSHTRYGHQVAIVGFMSSIDENIKRNHIQENHFAIIEREMMQVEGVVAILAVFYKQRMKMYFDEDSLEDITLGAALLINPYVDLKVEFSRLSFDKFFIDNLRVIVVRHHFTPDNDGCDSEDYRRERFKELFSWREPDRFPFDPTFSRPETKMYDRNRALLNTRCSLNYPHDRYQSDSDNSHLFTPFSFNYYQQHVLTYLWNIIKNSSLCCCVSKFYCTTSTTKEKCQEGCCRKCESNSSEEQSDSEIGSDSDSSSNFDTEEKSSSSNSSHSEDFISNLSS